MRKLGAGVLLLVICLGLGLVQTAPVRADGTGPASATVLFSRANAWAGPGQGFWTVGVLSGQETVPIIGVTADGMWWQVTTRFGLAYVSAGDVNATNVANVPVIDPGPMGVITGGIVTVRAAPGIGARRLGVASNGQQFFILTKQENSTWIKIHYIGGIGWVNGLLTSVGGDVSTTATVMTSQGPRAIINTAALNVHTGPGSQFKIIGTLSGGDVVPIIGRTPDGSWIKVTTIFGDGWINFGLVIQKDYFGNAPIITTDNANTQKAAEVLVETGTVNVRKGPNIAFDSITTVDAGAVLPILGQSADHAWWLVQIPNGKGWVSKALVQARGSFGSVPVVQP